MIALSGSGCAEPHPLPIRHADPGPMRDHFLLFKAPERTLAYPSPIGAGLVKGRLTGDSNFEAH